MALSGGRRGFRGLCGAVWPRQVRRRDRGCDSAGLAVLPEPPMAHGVGGRLPGGAAGGDFGADRAEPLDAVYPSGCAAADGGAGNPAGGSHRHVRGGERPSGLRAHAGERQAADSGGAGGRREGDLPGTVRRIGEYFLWPSGCDPQQGGGPGEEGLCIRLPGPGQEGGCQMPGELRRTEPGGDGGGGKGNRRGHFHTAGPD